MANATIAQPAPTGISPEVEARLAALREELASVKASKLDWRLGITTLISSNVFMLALIGWLAWTAHMNSLEVQRQIAELQVQVAQLQVLVGQLQEDVLENRRLLLEILRNMQQGR